MNEYEKKKRKHKRKICPAGLNIDQAYSLFGVHTFHGKEGDINVIYMYYYASQLIGSI